MTEITIDYDRCEGTGCAECVDICPVSAFTGTPFKEDEPRETRYDASKCEKYLHEEAKWEVCGLCVYICPYGRER